MSGGRSIGVSALQVDSLPGELPGKPIPDWSLHQNKIKMIPALYGAFSHSHDRRRGGQL